MLTFTRTTIFTTRRSATAFHEFIRSSGRSSQASEVSIIGRQYGAFGGLGVFPTS